MTVICHIDDIAEQSSMGFVRDEISYFAVKKSGQIYLYRNRCPHLGIELNWQENTFLNVDNQLIQCSTHGALFVIEDGECVAGPCQGQQLIPIPFDIIDQKIVLNAI